MSVVCLEPELEIQQRIEFTRALMNRLAEELGHVHPKVMQCSQQLDMLLLEYYAITGSMRAYPLRRQG